MIAETSIPRLAPGVRLAEDPARARTVLLGPERLFVPDATGLAVLRLIDGTTSAGGIADALASTYAAPRQAILADVLELLAELAQRGALTTAPIGT